MIHDLFSLISFAASAVAQGNTFRLTHRHRRVWESCPIRTEAVDKGEEREETVVNWLALAQDYPRVPPKLKGLNLRSLLSEVIHHH